MKELRELRFDACIASALLTEDGTFLRFNLLARLLHSNQRQPAQPGEGVLEVVCKPDLDLLTFELLQRSHHLLFGLLQLRQDYLTLFQIVIAVEIKLDIQLLFRALLRLISFKNHLQVICYPG